MFFFWQMNFRQKMLMKKIDRSKTTYFVFCEIFIKSLKGHSEKSISLRNFLIWLSICAIRLCPIRNEMVDKCSLKGDQTSRPTFAKLFKLYMSEIVLIRGLTLSLPARHNLKGVQRQVPWITYHYWPSF